MKIIATLAALLAAAGGMCPGQEPPPIPKITCRNFPGAAVRAAPAGYIPEYRKDWFANAYLSNGLVGIRPGPDPLVQAQTVVSGFVYSNPAGGFENIAPAPYPLATDIRAGGVRLLEHPELVTVRSQSLDMASGELTTEMTFAAGERMRLELEILQFASRSVPSLLCQQIAITAAEDTAVEILSKILREGIPGVVYRDRTPSQRVRVDQVLGLQSDRGSKLGIAVLNPAEPGVQRKQPGAYALLVKKGEAAHFHTIAAMVSSAYHPDPDLEAIRVASWGGMLGFDTLRERNRREWADLWRARVKVYGDGEAQRALDNAFFYLHSSAHAALKTGIPPFGLSQYRDYFGHVFWDMDHWMMPAVLPAAPRAAEAMLLYRLSGLAAAERHASSYGFRGAMYPWEGGVDGSDATPAEADTSWAEHHVTPEVALAFWEYGQATGDPAFLRDAAWPVLKAVAEWIESRGTFTSRGFEFHNLMGHNEWLTNVKNDSHFNLLCKMALRAAIGCAERIGVGAPERWTRIEKSVFLPIDAERGILLPFDQDTQVSLYNEARGEYEEMSALKNTDAYTLANASMLFFHDPPLNPVVFANTWRHEEELRGKRAPAPNVPASFRAPGFTAPPLAACAAFFGERRKAAELFRLACEKYTLAPYGINKEYQPYRDGNYLMNQASLLMAAMYGFTGLRISGQDWRQYPAALPEGWTRIEIDRLWINGKPMKVVAEHGRKADLRALAE